MKHLPVRFRRAFWLAAVPWVLAIILAGVLRSGLVVNPVLA